MLKMQDSKPLEDWSIELYTYMELHTYMKLQQQKKDLAAQLQKLKEDNAARGLYKMEEDLTEKVERLRQQLKEAEQNALSPEDRKALLKDVAERQQRVDALKEKKKLLQEQARELDKLIEATQQSLSTASG